MALSELQQNFRLGIVETLQLLSSKEEQLEFQRQVPIADVSAELLCLWFDTYYAQRCVKETWFQSAFSAPEKKAMEVFNSKFDTLFPGQVNLPYIEEFVLTPEWAKMSEAAAIALRVFQPDGAAKP